VRRERTCRLSSVLQFFLVLNIAVGGPWPGNPDSGSRFPDDSSLIALAIRSVVTGGVHLCKALPLLRQFVEWKDS